MAKQDNSKPTPQSDPKRTDQVKQPKLPDETMHIKSV